MSTSLTIGGSSVTIGKDNAWPISMTLRFADGYSTLMLQRRGGALPGLPDPWLGKTVSLSVGGTARFKGDVSDVSPSWTNIGWVSTYLCRDLKARVDRIPMTDANTLTDTAAFNLQSDDPLAFASRQGRTTGQILTEVLTMTANATNLDAKGVGAYTTLSPPTLPSSTTTDLSALTIIPPTGVYVQGEKLIASIIAFLRFWAPNHLLWIQPTDGAIRVLDKRTFSGSTLTLGTDPIMPTPLRRSVGECYQRVVVRGQPIAERKVVSTLDGTLDEDFAWGSYTNTQAKDNWTPEQNLTDQQARDEGTCTCPSTTTVTVTSSDTGRTWTSNYWDQTSTGHQGIVDLVYTSGSGINWVLSRKIVSNTSLSAGGTSTLTVDMPMPATNYNHYKIRGLTNGSGLVWKKYKVHDSTMGAAMARMLTYPGAWIGYNGNVTVMTSYPMGSVVWSSNGNPPYEERSIGITLDPSTSHVYFLQPTYVVCGYHKPVDVRAMLAINTGVLTATYPPDSGGPVYAGTSNTVEGMTETLTVMVEQWRDPINQSAMDSYASDLLDSVKDSIVDGTVTYHGLYSSALTPGVAISVTGNGYTTGWEGLDLPILECTLRWNSGTGTQYTTEMSVSNRRAHFSASAFLHPDRQIGGQSFDGAGFGYSLASMSRRYQIDTTQGLGITPGEAQIPGWITGEPPKSQALRNYEYNQEVKKELQRNAPISNKDYNKLIEQLEGSPMTYEERQRQAQRDKRADDAIDKEMAAATVYEPKGFVEIPPTATPPEMPTQVFDTNTVDMTPETQEARKRSAPSQGDEG